MLELVKLALRVSSSAFDDQLNQLIAAALADLGVTDITTIDETDPLIIQAVTTYCKMNFGEPQNWEILKKSYDEQKAQLLMSSGYTSWSDDE